MSLLDKNDTSIMAAVCSILETAGFREQTKAELENESQGRKQVYEIFEAWLGIKDLDQVEMTFEDGGLWNRDVMLSQISQLLVRGWTPAHYNAGENGRLMARYDNALINHTQQHPDSSGNVSLNNVYDSIQLTTWFSYWIDLSVPDVLMSDEEESSNIIQCLLRYQADHPSSSQSSFLRALFTHIEFMPILQAQIYQYAQHLKSNSPEIASSDESDTATLTQKFDPKKRLQQYQHAQDVTVRLEAEWHKHTEHVQKILELVYVHGNSSVRTECRHNLGRLWTLFISQAMSGSSVRQENTKAAYMSLTLHLLYRILLGVSATASSTDKPGQLSPSYSHLLTYHLIPLHKPDALVLWRDQTSILELYHSNLVQCIAVILQKQPDLLPKTLLAIIQPDVFPSTGGNTPKQVLLLHEIDTYLGLMDPTMYLVNADQDASWLVPLWTLLSRCMATEHSRVAQRALTMFKNKQILQLVKERPAIIMKMVLPVLVRKSQPSWNPTVRKMTYNVLDALLETDRAVFESTCQGMNDDAAVFGQASDNTNNTHSVVETKQPSHTSIVPKNVATQSAVTDHSLKAGMGDWRPPSRPTKSSMPPPISHNNSTVMPTCSTANKGSQPPLTVTGVAPWANTTKSNASHGTGIGRGSAPWASKGNKSSLQPPSTITGVAPWAIGPHNTKSKTPVQKVERSVSEENKPILSTTIEEKNVNKTPFQRVLEYMDQLKPPPEETGLSSWSKAQMAESPTLLPDLRFYDLVFGHELGEGAFGAVRYARLISKDKTRSQWPEYAVKVVSTEKIQELGYEASIQREIAVLRILSHPGIARLVSSFRFREGAYLVLEYASGGDLHSLLKKHGSLDNDSTRFVIGEVTAALASIHDTGLVYADLKPENIVITEAGHVKLTDFGACRPVTPEATARVRTIAKGLLKELRSGGWRDHKDETGPVDMDIDKAESNGELSDMVSDDDIDDRIEGTTAYLPPEVIMGDRPTEAADSWALGCVMYQCLTGRPPLLDLDDESTKNRIVNFDVDNDNNEINRLFAEKHAKDVSSVARDLIRHLLDRNVGRRYTTQQAADHDFFTAANVNVFTLYQQEAYPLDVGSVEAAPDAQWSRRQFSSIWAPQPKAYNVVLPSESDKSTNDTNSTEGPIQEGDEGGAYFTTSKELPSGIDQNDNKLEIPRPQN